MVVAAIIAGIISGAASTGLLALINAALHGTTASRGPLVWGFVGLCILVPLTRIVSELLLTFLGQGTIYDLRMSMSRKMLAAPLRHLEEVGAPRLMSILTGDIPSITNVVTTVPVLCINLAILVGSLIYLGWLSWQVLLLVVVAIVVGVVSYQLPATRAILQFRRVRRVRDDLYDHFRTLTEGTKELKLHYRRREQFLTRVLEETAQTIRRGRIEGQKIYTVASAWGQLLVFVIIGIVVFALPVVPWLRGTMDLETLSGYTLVLLYLMTPLQVMMNSLPSLSQAEVALRRIDELGLDLERHATEGLLPEAPPERSSWQSVELVDAEYVYQRPEEEGRFKVGPLSLRLTPGEVVFLAGGNGSGKTTLAKLLVGLYPPDSGTVSIDGTPVTDANREAYRQYFTAVFADNFLFDTLLGLESPELDERARQYLQELAIDHKVTVEQGRFSTTELSTGQRKRLALLTAYLEDRPIYLFDEWAADQDPAFRDIFYLEILPELKRRGKTVVVISHDDRYYGVGDRLVQMELGRIVSDTVSARPAPAAG